MNAIFPGLGATIMAIGIMVSTFGCANGLILAGARAYYAMARDGLFFRASGQLNAAKVPAWGLLLQGMWAVFLVLPRTYDPATRAYGNLYNNLLDYIISAALIFYILTIAGIFRLHCGERRSPVSRGRRRDPGVVYRRAAAILLVLFVCVQPPPGRGWRSCCSASVFLREARQDWGWGLGTAVPSPCPQSPAPAPQRVCRKRRWTRDTLT